MQSLAVNYALDCFQKMFMKVKNTNSSQKCN